MGAKRTANGWIAYDKKLPSKPEIGKLMRDLKITRERAVLACMDVWAWADDLTENGYIEHVTLAEIDYAARLDGFGAVLAQTDWLSVDDGGVIFEKWERYNGASAKQRLRDAERKRRERAK